MSKVFLAATKKGKDQRDRIIGEAFRCIYKYGLVKTNAGLISEKLKTPPSLFFYYFPKQALLYNALIERMFERNRALAAAMASEANAQTPWEHLEIYIKSNITWAVQYPEHIALVFYGMLDTSAKSDIRTLVIAALRIGEDRVYNLITEGMALKTFRPSDDKHPRELARMIHQEVMGAIFHLHAFRGEDTDTPDNYIKRCIDLTHTLLKPKGRDTDLS